MPEQRRSTAEAKRSPVQVPELSQRDLKVLQAIIDDYTQHAGPVGSKALARSHALGVSPATLRSVMADLEALGLLVKPHSSAGRVPTALGYRLYVDRILPLAPLPRRARDRVDRRYSPAPEGVDALLQRTGEVLSSLTRQAAVIALPRLSESVYQQIRFVRLRARRVLAVLVTRTGQVQNRAFVVEDDLSQADLDRMGRYLDSLLIAAPLDALRRQIEEALQAERARLDRLYAQALALSAAALDQAVEETPPEILVDGRRQLFEQPEFADPGRLRELLEALEEKAQLVRVLERAETSPGIQVFIGEESGFTTGPDLAMVVATYSQGDQVLGALGVVGPSRMDYSRIVPFVDYTAGLVTRLVETCEISASEPSPAGAL